MDEACNRGNLSALDDLLPPSSATEDTDGPPWGHLRELLAAFRVAAPDAQWTITEQISAGATVVTRLSVAAAFSGPLLGLAPPGRPATLTGVAISRFAEGRLVDLWLQADLLGLLQQVGVLPPLDLARTVAMAQVARAGALLAAEPVTRSSRAGLRTPPDVPTAPLGAPPAPHSGVAGVSTTKRPRARKRSSRCAGRPSTRSSLAADRLIGRKERRPS